MEKEEETGRVSVRGRQGVRERLREARREREATRVRKLVCERYCQREGDAEQERTREARGGSSE